MMYPPFTCFLASSPFLPGETTLCTHNNFREELLAAVPAPCRGVYVASDPRPGGSKPYDAIMRDLLASSGIRFASFITLEDTNAHLAGELISAADFIILAGGHVPTQNEFINRIGLRTLLQGFSGVLMGISAGTMNSASVVYAQPELEGEALDPAYKRFLPGVGLTDAMILPHYQQNKDEVLDGLRIYEDIAVQDSIGRTFYVLPDGSYLHIHNGRQELRGEAYRIHDGKMEQIQRLGESMTLA